MTSSEESPIEKLRRLLGTGGDTTPSMARLSTDGGIPIEQTQMAPEGLEWLEDISPRPVDRGEPVGLRDPSFYAPQGVLRLCSHLPSGISW